MTMKKLSKREQDVVRLKAHGLGNKEIACQLGISVRTVETYMTRIKWKFKVGTTIEMIILLQSANLLTDYENLSKRY